MLSCLTTIVLFSSPLFSRWSVFSSLPPSVLAACPVTLIVYSRNLFHASNVFDTATPQAAKSLFRWEVTSIGQKLMVLKFQLYVLCQTKLFLNSKTSIHNSHACNLSRDTQPLLKPHNLSWIQAISPQHVTQPFPKSQNLSFKSFRLSFSHPFPAYVTSSIQVRQPLITSHLLFSSLATSDHITQPLLVSCNLSFESVATQPLLASSQKYHKETSIIRHQH